jgi:hypothetical protein
MDEQAVKFLGQAVVADFAPHEAPLFEPISRSWFANPNGAKNRPATDDNLAFGDVAELTSLVTPVILAVSSRVVMSLAEDFSRTMVNAAGDAIAARIKRLLHHEQPREVLSRAQLARVREEALQTAREQNFPADQAEKLANVVIARLAEPVSRA